MALFDFLKKKERELPLPPPPLPPLTDSRSQGDFAPIRAPPQLRAWEPEQHDELQAQLPPLPPLQDDHIPNMELHEEYHDVPLLPAPREEKEVVFDKTVLAPKAPEQSASARTTLQKVPAKTFVSVNDYKQILTETNMVRQRLMSADNFVKKLQDLKVEEEKSLERWRSQLEDVEKKLAYVDQLIERSQR